MIKDILKSYHPEVIRLFLLSNHYRSPIDFTHKAMEEASIGLDRIYALLERVDGKKSFSPEAEVDGSADFWKRFCEAMDDDFNTARGIGILFDAVHHINRKLDEGVSPKDSGKIKPGVSDMLKIGNVIGILKESPDVYFDNRRNLELKKRSMDPAVIEKLIDERNTARKEKNWEKADQIREQLTDMNIALQDRPDGTVWRFAL
jgi:cysteinyl-tRNA synthetase